MDQDAFKSNDLLEIAEASDRAGALVAEHVRAIVRSAEEDAVRIRSEAEDEAARVISQALEAVGRVLGQIDALEAPLGHIVSELRREADRLGAGTGSEQS